MEHIHPLPKENTMFNSILTRLAHVAGVAYSVVYVIVKTNIEIVKQLAKHFAPARKKEEAKTVGDLLDEIKDGLTDEEKAAVDEAFEDEFMKTWKNIMSENPNKETED